MTNGSESDDIESQVARLEAALERIERLAAARPAVAPESAVSETVVVDTALVAARLDSMIARLRAAVED